LHWGSGGPTKKARRIRRAVKDWVLQRETLSTHMSTRMKGVALALNLSGVRGKDKIDGGENVPSQMTNRRWNLVVGRGFR